MKVEFDFEEIWQETLEIVKERIDEANYRYWLDLTTPIQFNDDLITVEVINEFFLEWLEIRYEELINSTLSNLCGKKIKVKFITPSIDNYYQYHEQEDQEPSKKNGREMNGSKKKGPLASLRLNPKYTFSSFVIGNSNRFAHAACLAVADTPAKAYNPLFIYGDVGLGKTHLMQAIGHSIIANNSDLRIVYIPSETFTNELIYAIRDDKTVEFRQKYRNIDVLLIDDIQFIARKERTQEEFFHTFNTLHEANKQMVISSDRPPKEIPTLEERLRSRFESGLIADIHEPDLETRIAILDKKASMENLSVPNEVILFIAKSITSNIRDMEGALIRTIAFSSLTNTEISMELAENVLKDILPNKKPQKITPRIIKEKLCYYYGIPLKDLDSKKRTQLIAFPRQIAMYLTRELTDCSFPNIGKAFGGRDHTTVLHAHKKISHKLEEDEDLLKEIEDIKSSILNP